MVIFDAARNFDAIYHLAKNIYNRAAHRALAAPRLANQAERFALFELEAYAVHRFHFRDLAREYAAHDGKAHAQILDFQNLHGFTRWQRTQCPGEDLDQLRLDRFAALEPLAASRHELATGREIENAGHVARNRGKPLEPFAVHSRQRCQQAARVRMQRILEKLLDRRHFLNFSGIHDDHPVAGLRHDGQIVCDQQNGRVLPLVLDRGA